MKKIIFLLCIVYSSQTLSQDSLQALNSVRNKTTLAGMKVLGGWGALNLGAGIAGWATSERGSHQYFHQMNTFWGATNLAIALLSHAGTRKRMQTTLGVEESIKAQKQIEKIFLVNGGIDFAYIGTGIYLNTRGNSRNNDQLKGYGTAVIMQGAFLLLFDCTMYSLLRSNGKKLNALSGKTSFNVSGSGVGLVYNF